MPADETLTNPFLIPTVIGSQQPSRGSDDSGTLNSRNRSASPWGDDKNPVAVGKPMNIRTASRLWEGFVPRTTTAVRRLHPSVFQEHGFLTLQQTEIRIVQDGGHGKTRVHQVPDEDEEAGLVDEIPASVGGRQSFGDAPLHGRTMRIDV